MDNSCTTKNVGNSVSHESLFEQVTCLENLLLAWAEFKKGKENKRDVVEFALDLEDNLFELQTGLAAKTYRHSHYTSFYIHDPKLRHINKAQVCDRIVHHALYKVIEPFFEKGFIFDSFSSRKEKGTHKAVLRLRDLAWRMSRNNTKVVWAMKCDVRKFFDSINHQILMRLIQKRITDSDTIWLIEEIIGSYPSRERERERERERVNRPSAEGCQLAM